MSRRIRSVAAAFAPLTVSGAGGIASGSTSNGCPPMCHHCTSGKSADIVFFRSSIFTLPGVSGEPRTSDVNASSTFAAAPLCEAPRDRLPAHPSRPYARSTVRVPSRTRLRHVEAFRSRCFP